MPYSQEELRTLITNLLKELRFCSQSDREELKRELDFYRAELRVFV